METVIDQYITFHFYLNYYITPYVHMYLSTEFIQLSTKMYASINKIMHLSTHSMHLLNAYQRKNQLLPTISTVQNQITLSYQEIVTIYS